MVNAEQLFTLFFFCIIKDQIFVKLTSFATQLKFVYILDIYEIFAKKSLQKYGFQY